MKAGQTLAQIATEIERQADAKRDFIADSRQLVMAPSADRLLMKRPAATSLDFGINRIAHEQIAAGIGMHSTYYRKCQVEAPDLLAVNVNRWLQQTPNRHTVRTMDGNVRALLSDKARIGLDNFSLLKSVLPYMLNNSRFLFISGAVTEEKFHLKLVDQSINLDIPVGKAIGDGSHTIVRTLAPSLYFGNSEVGRGSYFFELGKFEQFCTNLAWFAKAMRKVHLGSRADVSDDVYELLSDDTRRLTDEAVHAQVRDVMQKVMTEEGFRKMLAKVEEAGQDSIGSADVPAVIELVGKHLDLTEGERKGVLTRMIEGGNLSRAGLEAAITRHAADVDDYDRASELERIGGNVINLPRTEWNTLLKQAA